MYKHLSFYPQLSIVYTLMKETFFYGNRQTPYKKIELVNVQRCEPQVSMNIFTKHPNTQDLGNISEGKFAVQFCLLDIPIKYH